MNTAQKLRDHVATVVGLHKHRYAEDASELIPQYFLFKANDESMIIVTPFSNEMEKKMSVLKVREIALSQDYEYMVFSFESWAVSSEQRGGYSRNADNPARREMLSVIGASKFGDVHFHPMEMNRDSAGVFTGFTEIEDLGGATASSLFNIFDESDDPMDKVLAQLAQTVGKLYTADELEGLHSVDLS